MDEPTEQPTEAALTAPSIGATVYNDDGEALGTVRGFEESGFFVTTEEGMDAMSVEHEHAGPAFGEAELMWRCGSCGAMGDVEDVPDQCPDCGASAEELYYWTED